MINVGPLSIQMPSIRLKKAPAPQLPQGEKGSAGRIITRYGRSGAVLNLSALDYKTEMQPPQRWATVESMLNDDAVGAAFAALTLPILAAPLTVEPGTQDALGREMAEFCQADLEGMSTSLHQHRAEVLDSLPYGVTVLEKDFEVREDGLIHLRNLVLRPNTSIIEWQARDERGGPRGIVQLDGDGREIELEIERLLIFTHGRRGANITGRSIFRSAYKAWWYKDKLERIASIAAERGAVGIPVGEQTGDDDDLATDIESILQGVRASEEAFVREIAGRFKFRMEGLTGDRVDVIPILESFKRSIYVSVLADFLALGTADAGGSWALSRDKSSFFVMALRSILNMVEDTYARYLITPWARANWGDVPTKSLPKVTHGALNTRNVAEWFTALTSAVKDGVLFPDPQMQAMAREILEIPELPDRGPGAQTAEERAAQQPNQPGEKPAALPGVQVQQAAPKTLEPPRLESLVKIEALGITVRFKEMEGALDRGEGRMVERVSKLQQKQARRLAARGGKIIRGKSWDQLAAEELPSDEEAAAILEELDDLYDLGEEEYGRELQSQGATPQKVEDSGTSKALLAAFAVFAGARLADRMLSAWGAEVLSGARGEYDAAAVAEAIGGGGGKLLADLARQGASLAFGQGRTDAAAANAAVIDRELYTAVMDANTCGPCAEADGQEFAVGEGPGIPNPACEGGDRCRCERVPVVGKEAPKT